MPQSAPRKPSQAPLLLIGILITLLAVMGHRFLPERRLVLDSTRPGGTYLLVESGNGAQAKQHWVDHDKLHYACQIPQATAMQGCGFAYQLAESDLSRGMDLSRFQTLKLTVRYQGSAQYLRVGIRNFDPRFSKVEDFNTPKYNFVNIPTQDLAHPIEINLSEFVVAEWWTTMYNHPREYTRPDLSNATAVNIDLQGNVDLAGTRHDIWIKQLEFVGDWISAESWYLGLLSLWMVLGTAYGVWQWVVIRREHRQQIDALEHEKDKFQKLSTTDALTNVLNRHGIEQFIADLGVRQVPASVIVIDLDHFKRINDERGHATGDRVLRMLGEILRAGSRNTDAVGRWGGEEFVLVCPGASLSNAADLAEKLRHRIMDTNFIPEDPRPITASFGVATSANSQGFDDAFRKADQALYLAKSRGRNCVVAANENDMHTVTGARKSTLALVTGRFKLHK